MEGLFTSSIFFLFLFFHIVEINWGLQKKWHIHFQHIYKPLLQNLDSCQDLNLSPQTARPINILHKERKWFSVGFPEITSTESYFIIPHFSVYNMPPCIRHPLLWGTPIKENSPAALSVYKTSPDFEHYFTVKKTKTNPSLIHRKVRYIAFRKFLS